MGKWDPFVQQNIVWEWKGKNLIMDINGWPHSQWIILLMTSIDVSINVPMYIVHLYRVYYLHLRIQELGRILRQYISVLTGLSFGFDCTTSIYNWFPCEMVNCRLQSLRTSLTVDIYFISFMQNERIELWFASSVIWKVEIQTAIEIRMKIETGTFIIFGSINTFYASERQTGQNSFIKYLLPLYIIHYIPDERHPIHSKSLEKRRKKKAFCCSVVT